MSVDKIDKLVERAARAHHYAMRAQLRYTWRPGTHTGNEDLRKSEEWEGKFYDILGEIKDALKGAA